MLAAPGFSIAVPNEVVEADLVLLVLAYPGYVVWLLVTRF